MLELLIFLLRQFNRRKKNKIYFDNESYRLKKIKEIKRNKSQFFFLSFSQIFAVIFTYDAFQTDHSEKRRIYFHIWSVFLRES